MIKQIKNFRIVPIFNQNTPGVWHDFIRIEATCDTELHELSYPTQPIIDAWLCGYKGGIRENKHNFAFGAYTNKHMIGFAKGHFCPDNEMYLDRLYVLPKYHRCGIGAQLLKAVEQTSTLIATKVSLIPLSEAIDFYEQKNGYKQISSYMEKELSPIRNSIVPVFQWIKKDFNVKINISVDTITLKRDKYQPIFVHVNDDSEIDAVATRTKCGTKKIWDNQSGYRKELLTALNKTK